MKSSSAILNVMAFMLDEGKPRFFGTVVRPVCCLYILHTHKNEEATRCKLC